MLQQEIIKEKEATNTALQEAQRLLKNGRHYFSLLRN